MIFRSLMTSHNPNLDTYNADAANALPGVLSEAFVYTRPGVSSCCPPCPTNSPRARSPAYAARNQVRIDSLSWDLPARTGHA